ncbi:hypothetical protein AV530_019963 [Patagioenas fasciata monilis]|uniref:Uncharacterized protein n=1 Tax=Patagioenas fasciata monilis TaxID=372326 RepID=A0A1V4JHJ8_PATFA|nr:hypothetical protein AV530_019963 [Patagioenas fasciata monilis]
MQQNGSPEDPRPADEPHRVSGSAISIILLHPSHVLGQRRPDELFPRVTAQSHHEHPLPPPPALSSDSPGLST